MGQIVLGVVAAIVLSAVFGFWRRRRRNTVGPGERLLVGLLAAGGGVWLAWLVVFVMPALLAYEWLDIGGIFFKLVTFMVGFVLALSGVSMAIAALGAMRTPRE